MNITEVLNQVYSTGILAFAIILLAIAIVTYPTIRKYSGPNKRK